MGDGVTASGCTCSSNSRLGRCGHLPGTKVGPAGACTAQVGQQVQTQEHNNSTKVLRHSSSWHQHTLLACTWTYMAAHTLWDDSGAPFSVRPRPATCSSSAVVSAAQLYASRQQESGTAALKTCHGSHGSGKASAAVRHCLMPPSSMGPSTSKGWDLQGAPQ
jgi:hypothetical protein